MLFLVISSFSSAALAALPAVTSVSPTNLATKVSINEEPAATFSQAMDPRTLTPLTFLLKRGSVAVVGAVAFNPATNTASFHPTQALGLNSLYTATVTTGAKDLNGRALVSSRSWDFTTAACSQTPVDLGSAYNFTVLGGSTVTNTGLTSVTGDLGVSPGSAVTGFPPGKLVGTLHAADPASAAGIGDLATAYQDAAGRTLCPVSVAGNLGGQTLPPGLYKSTSSLAVSSGDLTLDAQGDSAAVFIFQMASTLTTTSGRHVILTHGAKATNVFWQVGSSATLGTATQFEGTILAHQAISLKTGASLTGRALAWIAAVTMDSNTLVKPAR